MDDNITLLCTGDLHLGRHPTRIPGELDGKQFSPKSIWRSTVQEAIDRDVDGVFVTGDIVDRENRFFEAYGPFEEGLSRLNEADIHVAIISGNHDFDVLPQLMDGVEFENVHLLGEGGEWERITFEKDGDPFLSVDGWSFPNEHVLQSPLRDYDGTSATDAPLIGLVHADLDSPESEYAPVNSSELVDTPVDGWLLGHIHKPQKYRSPDPSIIYPGSLQALNPSERGGHGPWMITADSTGIVYDEQISLASLRYDHLEVDVSKAVHSKDIPPIVSDSVSEHVHNSVETDSLALLLVRVTLTGRTAAHSELVDEREAIEQQLSFKEGSLPVRVERLEVDTHPEVDLEELAKGESPTAYLADFLLSLEEGEQDEDYRQLVLDSQDAMQRAHASSAYNELRREGQADRPDENDATETLKRQAKLMLDELLKQKEETV